MRFITSLIDKIIGSKNSRLLKKYYPVVKQINDLEASIAQLSDEELKAKTIYFKEKLAGGSTLDEILPEAFAVVREASKRVLGMRHFDVQLIGGMVLHDGNIAEMRTGEGKTLVSTLPAYLNALTGKGVHIVTVNDYLAKRDAHWMGQIHRFLGLTVGCIDGDFGAVNKKEAYESDITYGTNNEFGFDYLRDNLAVRASDLAQRKPNFAIIDEVDSILIDEARTPLIISGPTDDKSELYFAADEIIRHLDKTHFELDEESRSVTLNENGFDKVEELLAERGLVKEGSNNLYSTDNLEIMHHVTQALKAHYLFSKDKDYIVKNDKLILIDEFTGRMMDGRRFSDGLHQALEAKESVSIQPENQTLSSVTFQNYFRLYDKLSGMTGTADTEAAELKECFRLGVIQVPTNLPIQRIDAEDALYVGKVDKYKAIIEEIKEAKKIGRPVLVGTASIERSEELSEFLKKESIPHQVLNARYHEQEADIIAEAGRLGAITISTNMAGRGTDIQLGGCLEVREKREIPEDASDEERNRLIKKIKSEIEEEKKKVIEVGGLYVIGTERHESRRIDNQLRGRAGRQGDKGRSRFFLSLDDDLLRIFGGDKLKSLLKVMGMQEGNALEDKMLSKAIVRAQKKVEQKNYEARRQLMKYDDIINEQRSIVFSRRRELVEGHDFIPVFHDIIEKFMSDHLSQFCEEKSSIEDWEIDELILFFAQTIGEQHDFKIKQFLAEDGVTHQNFKGYLISRLKELHKAHIESWHEDITQDVHREYILRPLDFHWRHHLSFLDRLGKMISFRGYGQKDPLIEYKREAFESFSNFLMHWRMESVGRIMQLRVEYGDSAQDDHIDFLQTEIVEFKDPQTGEPINMEEYPRNAECPCGSGRKFKHCHGHPELMKQYAIS